MSPVLTPLKKFEDFETDKEYLNSSITDHDIEMRNIREMFAYIITEMEKIRLRLP